MVGYGFMARAHSNAWANVSHFFETGYKPVLKAAAARNVSKLRHFADMWGYESVETDWKALIERRDIDAIDIARPTTRHAEIAIAAAKAGKMVLCEKPLGPHRRPRGCHMVEAVEKAGVANMVVVQLPSGAGGDADQADGGGRQARQNLPLPRQVPAGLDDFAGRTAGRRQPPGGSTSMRRARV